MQYVGSIDYVLNFFFADLIELGVVSSLFDTHRSF